MCISRLKLLFDLSCQCIRLFYCVNLTYYLNLLQALSLLCETVKGHSRVKSKKGAKKEKISGSPWLQMDDNFLKLFDSISLRIVHLIDDSTDASDTSLKIAAISAIEILASAFSSYHSVISVWLASIAKYITSNNLPLSSSCLRTCSTLINVLGPRSLSELPSIMGKVINVSRSCVVENTRCSSEMSVHSSDLKESVMLSVAVTLEAVVEKLGGFLNPYLGDILELLVLHPNLVWGSDSKLKLKADLIRKLLTEKIPVSVVVCHVDWYSMYDSSRFIYLIITEICSRFVSFCHLC